jgi:DNA-binding Xre family transcriptional regulator
MRKQIIVKIRKVAESRGITSAYALQQQTGFSPTVANRLWFGKTTRFSIDVLATLCAALDCQPADLLVYESPAKSKK